jgi:hypothetical protein
MEFRSLASSNINGIAYDRDRQVLTVEFKNRSRYSYEGVPLDVYDDFLSASSAGEFFAENVKDVYPYRRVG